MRLLLTYLGTLPFLIASMFLYLQEQSLLGMPIMMFITTYSSIIISFLAGRLWGLSLSDHNQRPTFFLLSNIITLAGWASILFFATKLIFVVHIFLFLILLLVDHWLHRNNLIQSDHFAERITASIVVILALGSMIILS